MQLIEIIEQFDFEYSGDIDLEIRQVCGLENNWPNSLSYVASPQYRQEAQNSQIPVFLTRPDCVIEGKVNLFCDNPTLSMIHCARLFERPPMMLEKHIHESVVCGKPVHIAPSAKIAPNVTIGNHVTIGEGTRIYPGVVVMDQVTIGDDCIIHPNVTIGENTTIGNRVLVHAGVSFGADGYGYHQHEGKHVKIPQVGGIAIHDDVEIGANCTIDRGRFANTIIGEGTKLDNLVHIAHNVEVGKHCLLLGQVGIAGSAKLGDHILMAGQSGIVDHVSVASHVTLYAKSLITKTIQSAGLYAGFPARPMKLWQKAIARFYRKA